MMRKYSLLFILACLCTLGFAQQRPIHSLYMFDPLLINPAYAGSHVQLSGTAIYRNQWVNFEGAPRTFTGTVHSGFRKAKIGVGLIFGSDEIGVHSDRSAYGVYSYKIKLSERKGGGMINFGLQAGFNSLKSDFFKTRDRDGAEIGVVSKMNWNFGTGAFYRNRHAYAGFSIPYLVNNKVVGISNLISDSISAINSTGKQQRYYYLMGGLLKEINKIVKWTPSVLIRVQENAPLSFDINSTFVFYNAVGLGLSYRLNDSVIALFELQLNENFHVGYAYDINTSAIRQYSNGTHEIMLNYRIKIPKLHTGLECPSYW